MSFADADLSLDGFLGGRIRLWQPRKGYRAATDPVLLAAFVPAQPGQHVLDLGCGAGTAGLCLAARVGGLSLHGLELQPDYAELARRNAAENALEMAVHVGDLRHPPRELRALAFDHVVMNPPFFAAENTAAAADAGRDLAHREGPARIADWIAAGLRRARPGGQLALIHKTERLAEILAALSPRAGAIEILPIAARRGRASDRFLLRARKSSGGPLVLYPPLTMHVGSGHFRDENDYAATAQKVLRGMSDLLPPKT